MAAAADTPIIARFISSSFPDPPNGRVAVATNAAPLFGANMLVVAALLRPLWPCPPAGYTSQSDWRARRFARSRSTLRQPPSQKDLARFGAALTQAGHAIGDHLQNAHKLLVKRFDEDN